MPISRRFNGVRAAARMAFLALGLAGCGALDTHDPNIVDPGSLNTAPGAASRRIGAISVFTLAKDGDFNFVAGSSDASDGQILVSGILADEFINPGFIPSRSEIDLRQTQPINVTLEDFFRSLQRARAAAEQAADALQQFSQAPDTNTGIPEMLALAGLTYVYFAEDFCSGVPVSHIVNDTIVYGAQLTTAQVLDTAVVRFNLALAHPSIAPGDLIHSLASVGLARALLDQGKFAEAAAAVASITPDFVYNTEHAISPSALHNGVAEGWNGTFGTFDQEGGVGLDYVSANDPRITGDSGVGTDNTTDTFFPTKYGLESPIATADYLEAQLIIAESQLRAGQFGAMTTTLNDLRDAHNADLGLLGDLATPGNATAATDLLFRERGFWLFATGHRLGDMRRLIRQYGRATNTVFPNGLYFKNAQPYGPAVNLPLPRTETNNPNVKECLDRDP